MLYPLHFDPKLLQSVEGQCGRICKVFAPNSAIASLVLYFLPSLDFTRFKCKRYLIWTILDVLFVAVSGICFKDMITAKYNIMQWYGGALSVFVWGALLIYAISSISERLYNGTKFMIIFREHRFQLIMSLALLLFSVSANISLWPVQYLLVYTTMVLIDIDDEEMRFIGFLRCDVVVCLSDRQQVYFTCNGYCNDNNRNLHHQTVRQRKY